METIEKPSKSAVGRPKDPVKHMAILQAARKHFLQSGFVAARLDDIAADAGVSKLTIYSHFGNKEQLFQSMIESECLAHRLTGSTETSHSQSAEQILQQFGEAFLALLLDPDVVRMHRLMMSQAEENPEISRLFYQAGPAQVTQQLADRLSGIAARHAYAFPHPLDAAQMLLHAWKGELYFQATLNLQRQFEEQVVRAHVQKVVALFLRAHATSGTQTAINNLPTPPAADLSAPQPSANPNSRQWPWC